MKWHPYGMLAWQAVLLSANVMSSQITDLIEVFCQYQDVVTL